MVKLTTMTLTTITSVIHKRKFDNNTINFYMQYFYHKNSRQPDGLPDGKGEPSR